MSVEAFTIHFPSSADRDVFRRAVGSGVWVSASSNPVPNARWAVIELTRPPTVRSRRDRIVLVGQAPSRRGRSDRPLVGGRSGAFLMELTGCSLRQYARHFERRNVLASFPGSAPAGDLFPSNEAREAATAMAADLRGRRVVLVGRAVGEAFALRDPTFYSWQNDPRGFCAAVIPHPSGRNRHWNREGARAEAIGFFARLLGEEVLREQT